MVEARNCSFCGGEVEPGTGKMYVKKDGSIFYFCCTKCENNYKLGRVPRKVLWTTASRKSHGKV